LTEPDVELKKRQEDTFKTFIKRRLKGEPNAYITGHREFYGLDFIVEQAGADTAVRKQKY